MILAMVMSLSGVQDHSKVFPGGEDAVPLTRKPAPRRCERAPDVITVCAEDPAQFRLNPVEPRYDPKAVRARLALPGGGSVGVEAEQRGVGGVSVPSAMLKLRIPLGRKREPDK